MTEARLLFLNAALALAVARFFSFSFCFFSCSFFFFSFPSSSSPFLSSSSLLPSLPPPHLRLRLRHLETHLQSPLDQGVPFRGVIVLRVLVILLHDRIPGQNAPNAYEIVQIKSPPPKSTLRTCQFQIKAQPPPKIHLAYVRTFFAHLNESPPPKSTLRTYQF